ncbi:MAG: polysaccharide biosynthesis tyrosine autokinase [Acidobacteriota bacterium]|nr:polysaccharide biosynthesis tyrosine autokinase [Acidobacteriota bacterium]
MQIIKSSNFSSVPAVPESRPAFSAPPSFEGARLNFREVLAAHKLLLTACVLFCLALAALFTFASPPVYQAKGVIELQSPPAGSVYQTRDGEGAGAINAQTFDSWIETQIGILESDTLVRRVVARLHLEDRLNAEPQSVFVGLFHLRSHPINREEAFETATKNLKVRQSRLNNLVEVLYNSHDPRLSAEFVNALADEYEQQNRESRWQMAQSAGNWLTGHLADLRTKLEDSETALQNYSRSNGIMFVAADNKDSVAKDRLRQLQEALSHAQSERMAKQAQMEMAASATPDSVPQVLDNAALKEYEVKLSDLERQMAEYRQIYTENNPRIVALQSQIASLQASFNRTRQSVLTRLRNEYQASLRDEKMLSGAYTDQTHLVSGQDEKMIRYDTLKHEVDTNRTIYESLLQKVKESSVNVALQATSIRVVDAARPPLKPYKPNTAINLGGGLLAGLILGLTSVSLRHRSDRMVRKPGVVQNYLAAPELGVIPSFGPRAINSPHMDERAWLDPNSSISESFRAVMTSILFATGGRAGIHLVVITSPEAGEGKTVVASNLGAAFAATGRRVLMVDADLRRPRLNKVFDMPNTPGLLEFAAEVHKKGATADINKFTKQSDVAGLFVMPAGDCTAGSANIFHGVRFSEVFNALRSEFDTIVVDAPPLLCVPEVRVMARMADGVVLVVRAGSTQVDEAVNAGKFISQDGGNLIGVVLNDAPLSSTPYYNRYVAAS